MYDASIAVYKIDSLQLKDEVNIQNFSVVEEDESSIFRNKVEFVNTYVEIKKYYLINEQNHIN